MVQLMLEEGVDFTRKVEGKLCHEADTSEASRLVERHLSPAFKTNQMIQPLNSISGKTEAEKKRSVADQVIS